MITITLSPMKGIGCGLCQTLHQMKAEVYAISRTKADLDSLEKEVSSLVPIIFPSNNERGRSYSSF